MYKTLITLKKKQIFMLLNIVSVCWQPNRQEKSDTDMSSEKYASIVANEIPCKQGAVRAVRFNGKLYNKLEKNVLLISFRKVNR